MPIDCHIKGDSFWRLRISGIFETKIESKVALSVNYSQIFLLNSSELHLFALSECIAITLILESKKSLPLKKLSLRRSSIERCFQKGSLKDSECLKPSNWMSLLLKTILAQFEKWNLSKIRYSTCYIVLKRPLNRPDTPADFQFRSIPIKFFLKKLFNKTHKTFLSLVR